MGIVAFFYVLYWLLMQQLNKDIDWLVGGANFERETYGEVGEIIYPAYNNTNGWFKSSRWDLIEKVDKKGKIIKVSCIWDYSTVRAIELMQLLNELHKKEVKKR